MNDGPTFVARTPLRCSPIRDIVTTKDGVVTEIRTIRLENDVLSITVKGQPGTLPFIEGEEYSVEFRTPQMHLPSVDETPESGPEEVNGTEGDMEGCE